VAARYQEDVRVKCVQTFRNPAPDNGVFHSTARRPFVGSFDGDSTPAAISTVSPFVSCIARDWNPENWNLWSISKGAAPLPPAGWPLNRSAVHKESIMVRR
jgi:hypothetical protein